MKTNDAWIYILLVTGIILGYFLMIGLVGIGIEVYFTFLCALFVVGIFLITSEIEKVRRDEYIE
jgi:Ca2+/Na+ antiporter